MDNRTFQLHEKMLAAQVDAETLAGVDDLVYQDPDVLESIGKIRAAEGAGRLLEAATLTGANRDLVEQARLKLLRAGGIIVNLNELEDESEVQRMAAVREVDDTLTGDETEDELLRKFGMSNEEGQLTRESINSPLFRKRTAMAFGAYISAVESHRQLVDYMQLTGARSSNGDAIAADRVRTGAHNAVAYEVAQDLGIEFDVARRLVAKMRDGVIPQASENEVYAGAALRAGVLLRSKYPGDRAATDLWEDTRKTIFPGRDGTPQ